MDDYDVREEPRPQGNRLGGLSMQTGVSILLIGVIAAVLWIFLGPMPDSGAVSDLPTATATRSAVQNAQRTPGFGATNATPGTKTAAIGNPVLGTPAGLGTVSASGGTPGLLVIGTPAAPAAQIRSGMFTEVTGTGAYGLRLRFGAGSDYVTIRIVNDGEVLLVMDASEKAEGETWWRVQDDLGNVGWVSQDYMKPALSPASWSPPVASPTFEAGSPGASYSP